jgi:hypothetical protein
MTGGAVTWSATFRTIKSHSDTWSCSSVPSALLVCVLGNSFQFSIIGETCETQIIKHVSNSKQAFRQVVEDQRSLYSSIAPSIHAYESIRKAEVSGSKRTAFLCCPQGILRTTTLTNAVFLTSP